MAAPTTDGFVHEVGFYGSDAEFAELVLPFAEEGRRRSEPVVFAYDPDKTQLLKQWLPDDPAYTYLTDTRPYSSPAKALDGWRRLTVSYLDAGAARVRIAGNVPHPGYGAPYLGWDRYEAALDRVLGDLPVWAPCLYDTRIAPPEVVQQARSLHRSVRGADGTRQPSAEFRERTRLADFLTAATDPIERTAPAFELTDPEPAAVRAEIRQLTSGRRLSVEQVEALVLAASEAVTNTIRHGVAPASVRAWAGDDRVVVEIRDSGQGPSDPLTGLFERGDIHATSGRGLWIAHLLDLDVAMTADEDGFSVRLRADVG